MTIRWINPLLGTGPCTALDDAINVTIIDVRDLVDKAGNENLPVFKKIEEGVAALKKGERVIVCCDYGMSRSNAVAAGILASFERRDFDDSLRQVLKATGETQVKLEPLMAVRAALGIDKKKSKQISSRNILLTGGNGFIGHALREALGGDFNVLAPSHEDIDISLGSTLLDLLVDEKGIDCIVHLANPRIYTSTIAMGQSLTMLRNVIDVCLTRNIPLVYPSGWEIYSGYSGILRADEAIPPLPRGLYGETKYLAESLISHCIRTAGLLCALVRSSPVYGKGSDRPKFIYNFIEKALLSKPIVTHRYRNGEPALDLLYIDDLIAAIVEIIKTGFIGTLNFGTGLLTSTSQIGKIIVDKLQSRSIIKHIDIDADVANIAMNWHHAHKKIGWKPKITIEKGMDLILSDYLSKRSEVHV
jgi:nucleoside-diphosphate-sugar epimerase/rhodanese-related sulfurtransferase